MAAKTKLPSTAGLTTREACLGDYQQITALTARNTLEIKTQDEWNHLWIENPVYKEFPNWAIGWVLEQDGEVVGFLGNIPLSYSFKGREIVSACTYSMSVDLRFRGHSILLIKRLLRWATLNLEFHFCTTANQNSARLLERLKIARVPVGDWGNSAFWITNHRGFMRVVLERKGWPKGLAYPASAALRLREKLTKRRAWMQQGWTQQASELCPCSSFDQRFDVFWEELQRAYPNRLLSTRSRKVLDWHFKHALKQNKAWILTWNEGPSRVLAYAIFCRSDNSQIQLKRMRLVDFQTLNGDHNVLIPMLVWGLRKCQQEGIHMLEAFGFRPDKQHVIDGLDPYRRRLASWAYFYRCLNKTLEEELRNADVWDPSHFDGDASI